LNYNKQTQHTSYAGIIPTGLKGRS